MLCFGWCKKDLKSHSEPLIQKNSITSVKESEDGLVQKYSHSVGQGERGEGEEEKEFKDIVAFDIGTRNSGYAYSKKESKEIYANTGWFNENIKTDSCLLICDLNKTLNYLKNPNSYMEEQEESLNKVFLFGHEAKEKFGEILIEMSKETSNINNNISYYQYFKMHLYDSNDNKAIYIPSYNNPLSSLKAEELFGLCVLYLRRHAIKRLEKSGFDKSRCDDIQWVVTIPAIWSPKAKQIMRNACELAGINSSKLKLALEPEAAALYCGISNEQSIPLKTGSKYLLVDAGGGTIDIVAHEIVNYDKKEVKEIDSCCGIDKGSHYINEKFKELLHKIFGKNKCDDQIQKYFLDWNDFIDNFERQKMSFQGNDKTKTLRLGQIPFRDINKQQTSNVPGVVISDQRTLTLSYDCVMEHLYNDIMNDIAKYIDSLLDKSNLQDIDYILLVGGFANCKLLQNTIQKVVNNKNQQKELNNGIKLFIPDRPEVAIMKGACIFGKNSRLIKSRKSRYTYGIKIGSADLKKYPKGEMTMTPFGKQIVSNVFNVVIKSNEDVSVKAVHKISLGRGTGNKTVTFPILQSTDPNVIYSNEASVTKIGSLSIDVPEMPISKIDADQIWFKVSFSFGDTEIKVKAICTKNDREVKTTVEFDCF